MNQTKQRRLSLFLGLFFLVTGSTFANTAFYELDDSDDDIPEVTDRVARIGAISGDVLLKRLDSDEWEDARLNLPLVEGDQLATAPGGLVEVQFNSNKHLWISGNSILKFTTLRDEGIALSLSQGAMTARVIKFDAAVEFFEIDAPKTTIALQQAGRYRVDAGKVGSADVRVTIDENGMARIYSESAGFTLRDGRSALVFIDGNRSGEWDLADAAQFSDDFDKWVAERIVIINDRLENAHFDEYYDDSIVGAEELTNYGDWEHTTDYGYMWRPSQSSIRTYSNWSPYQYGEWRWIPPYGWTWVNDEPWGWATYHYGRWVWHNSSWYWSPYGQQRYGRSIWRPALVIMSYWGNSIYWYPLPYNYGFYNYNRHYHRNRRYNRPNRPNRPQPTPTPYTGGRTYAGNNPGNTRIPVDPTGARVPPGGVMIIDRKDFGNLNSTTKVRQPAVANQILNTKIDPNGGQLPMYVPAGRNSTSAKQIPAINPNIKTGAAPRTVDVPLDNQLQKRQIFGNREPVNTPNNTQRVNTPVVNTPNTTPSGSTQTKTGAVQRQPMVNTPSVFPQEQTKQQPSNTTQPTVLPQRQIRTQPQTNTQQRTNTPPQNNSQPRTTTPSQPTVLPQRQIRTQPSTPPARSNPPAQTQRSSPPAQRSSPPAQRSSPPAQRSSPPAQRSSPPAQRSSPPAQTQRSSPPASRPAPSTSTKKDG